ncbi:MAG: helix-turn-helix transcriptional regulator [Elusimicrobia bacterium]|nr:helix-turn-helix transcriptional regulator [Elusimicrobiota bacterium]
MTLDRFSQITGLSRNAIGRIERDVIRHVDPRILGKLMGHFGDRLKEVFPEGDPYDCIIPPKTLGSWIKNQRLRRGMEQKELARRLGVHVFTIVRYERDAFQPDAEVRRRLMKLFGPGLERFLEPATISDGARRRPAPEGGRTRRSVRHEAKKQAGPAVQDRKGRVGILG